MSLNIISHECHCFNLHRYLPQKFVNKNYLLSKDSSLPKDLLGESETWQVISKSEPTNLHTNNKVNIEYIIENGDSNVDNQSLEVAKNSFKLVDNSELLSPK